jgi:hypothetical protein
MRKYLAVLLTPLLAVSLAATTSESAMVDAEEASTTAAAEETSAALRAAGTFGSMQVVCRSSHTNHDDPIVYPGERGAAHQHDFFGNKRTNAFSTRKKLRGKPTTCSRPGDRAAYWTPTLLKRGTRIVPDRVIAYYRTSRIRDIESIRPFPRGLKMIAGSHLATKDDPQPTKFVNWNCGDGVEGTAGMPRRCWNKPLRLRIEFPNCWNGRTLDSDDHKSHMAYAGVGGVRGCPRSHPVAVPALSLNFRWHIDGPLRRVKLSSGGKYSAHADFWNIWNQTVLRRLVRRCLQGGRICNSSISDAPAGRLSR